MRGQLFSTKVKSLCKLRPTCRRTGDCLLSMISRNMRRSNANRSGVVIVTEIFTNQPPVAALCLLMLNMLENFDLVRSVIILRIIFEL